MDETAPRSGTVASMALLVIVGLLAVIVPLVLSASPASAGSLERFGSCAELRAFTNATIDRASRLGVDDVAILPADGRGTGGAGGLATEDAASEAAPSAAGAASAAADTDVGATNTQVAGVDELDRADVAADGRALVALDVRWEPPMGIEPDGPTDAGPAAPPQLVLVGADGTVTDRAELEGREPRLTWDVERSLAWVVTSGDGSPQGQVLVHRYRTDDGLELDGTWAVTGWAVTGRRLDDRFLLIATDAPWARDQVPFAAGGGGTDPAVPCEEVWHPTTPTDSPGATLVAAFDASATEVQPAATAQVVGTAETVYASASAVYVTTTGSRTLVSEPAAAGETTTAVHRFALGDLGLSGSGAVPGQPLNQFALDEHDGHLRVATTTWSGDGPDNVVSVLDLAGTLDQVGQARGLGKPGETIQGVRFDGAVGYVVTFEQTDPLYVLDLADARAPQVVGQLEIPGFSSYLHPVGDGLVVGVGSAGDERGLTGGAWVQLFDVTDRQQPRLLDTDVLGPMSEAQHDHHAFAALGAGRFAVPFQDHPALLRSVPPQGASGSPLPSPARLTVRVYGTAERALARGVEVAFDLEGDGYGTFVRTAELGDGDLLIISGDGHLRRFAADGTPERDTALR